MNYYLLFSLAFLGVIFYAISSYRRQARQQKRLEEQLSLHNPDLQYDYNRFNTQKEKKAQVNIEQEVLTLNTDVHIIQVSNHTLILHVRARAERLSTTIGFKLLVQPFNLAIFETGYYQTIPVEDGHLFFFGEGASSQPLLDFAKRQDLCKSHGYADGNFAIHLDEIIPDPAENQVLIHGRFPNGEIMHLALQQDQFKLELQVPLSALKQKENFQQSARSVIG